MNRKQEKSKILTVKLEQSSKLTDIKALVVDTLGQALRSGDAPGDTVVTARFLYKKSAEKAMNRVAQILAAEGEVAEITIEEV